MTPTTPREALETIDTIYNGNGGERSLSSRECERILTALKPWLDNQRTPGTVEVCSRNPVVGCIDYAGRSDKSADHCKVFGCPLKVTK